MALAVCVATVTVIALRYAIHDEHLVLGHLSLSRQIASGAFPPFTPWSPSDFFRYHWGFDVLTAAVHHILTGPGVENIDLFAGRISIDLVAIFLSVCLAWIAAALVDEAGGWPAGGVWAVFFGGGLAFWLFLFHDPIRVVCLAQTSDACGVHTFPPQISNFFQHAVSLGAPLFFTWVLLAPKLHLSRAHPLLAISTVALLLSLGIAQVVFFAIGLLAALTAAPIWWSKEEAKRGWPWLLLFAAVGLMLAMTTGGILTPSPRFEPSPVRLRVPPGFPEGVGLLGGVYHQVVNLGIGLLLMPLFIWDSIRRRQPTVVMLTSFAIGGILVPQLFAYGHSWDIIKFPSASAFALSLLAVIVLYPKLRGHGWKRRVARLAFWLLLVPSGVAWAGHLVLPIPEHHRDVHPGGYHHPPHVWRLGRWLLAHGYQRDQLTLCLPASLSGQLSIAAGTSVSNLDEVSVPTHGFRTAELDALRSLYKTAYADLEPTALRRAQVHWLVIQDDQMRELAPAARQALNDPTRFRLIQHIDTGNPQRSLRLWWNLAYPLPEGLD